MWTNGSAESMAKCECRAEGLKPRVMPMVSIMVFYSFGLSIAWSVVEGYSIGADLGLAGCLEMRIFGTAKVKPEGCTRVKRWSRV